MQYRGLTALLAMSLCAQAAIIYVPGDQPTIQGGIDAAQDGDVVQVSTGRYQERIDFINKAIEVRGEANTVIDASSLPSASAGGVVRFSSGEGPGSVLTGFTITGGWAKNGGGIYCSQSSPTLSNCTIKENFASVTGGGIYCWYASSPTLTDCIIADNSADWYGGGISVGSLSTPTLTRCVIRGNWSWHGGGLSCSNASPNLTRCLITENEASIDAGGVECSTGAAPTLTNCVIKNNGAAGSGGGLVCYYAPPTLTHCTIADNDAAIDGGGIRCLDTASPARTHPICVDKRGGDGAGGIRGSSTVPTLTNCTIVGNRSRYGGGIYCVNAPSPMLTNCILWGDTPTEISGGSPALSYCDIQGGYFGDGNIDAAPKFRSYRGYDYVLWPGSPCIDSGTGEDDGIPWNRVHPTYGRYNLPAPDMGTYGGPFNLGWRP